MVKERRVLPADVYDTLEFSALAFGGIGTDEYWTGRTGCDPEAPVCFIGHLVMAQDRIGEIATVEDEMRGIITVAASDKAVQRINTRKRLPGDTRVSWPEYTRELNIVRGD